MKKFKFLALTAACGVMFAACGSSDSESDVAEEELIEEVSLEDETVEDAEEPIVEDVSEEATASADWDSVLDEYEEFVDSYINLMKKAKNGDVGAAAEYAEYMQKATSVSEKLAAADDDLTPAQMARYQKITMKMAKAAY